MDESDRSATMTVAQREWCRTCCTCHSRSDVCPGDLLATGDERHGWRVLVKTGHGVEAYGVLVAPSHDLWRARILTYPNVLWMIPGGGGSIKFVGCSPGQAERLAIEFIKKHCEAREFSIGQQLPPVETGVIDPEMDPACTGSPLDSAQQREPRKLGSIPVRYGIDDLREEALTDDLSEGGLFIQTRSPLRPGQRLRIQIEIDGSSIPLRGVVRWKRTGGSPGRPTGMGIELSRPPSIYILLVRKMN